MISIFKSINSVAMLMFVAGCVVAPTESKLGDEMAEQLDCVVEDKMPLLYVGGGEVVDNPTLYWYDRFVGNMEGMEQDQICSLILDGFEYTDGAYRMVAASIFSHLLYRERSRADLVINSQFNDLLVSSVTDPSITRSAWIYSSIVDQDVVEIDSFGVFYGRDPRGRPIEFSLDQIFDVQVFSARVRSQEEEDAWEDLPLASFQFVSRNGVLLFRHRNFSAERKPGAYVMEITYRIQSRKSYRPDSRGQGAIEPVDMAHSVNVRIME